MIIASSLTKRYRKHTVVDDISFEVATGKVTGFLGPNGAGKSTTMRLMLGLDNGRGITTFDGKSLSEYHKPSSIVGILLEAKAFHPTRSAYNHLRILANAGNIPEKRVEQALEIVGLSDAAKKKPGKFSLGMSQRLGIAAAILGEPKYLFLDEPANGLDPEGIAWLRQFIRDYASRGNAVFVSSHLLSEMSQMADNVVVIGKGKLIADTSMDALISRSSNGIYVRTTQLVKLKKALDRAHTGYFEFESGLLIKSETTDSIGSLAFTAGVPLLELRHQTASLEQAFLELTADAQEYKAKPNARKRGAA